MILAQCNTHSHLEQLYLVAQSRMLISWRFTSAFLNTSVKIIKNEVGCRDDTVPKTVDTRRHCEEE